MPDGAGSNEDIRLWEGILKKNLSVIPLALLLCIVVDCQKAEKVADV